MRRLIPYIVTIIITLVCVLAVYGATIFGSFGCDVTIVPVNKVVRLYTNPECTQTFIPPIHYGTMEQGQIMTWDFYCRNESTVATNLDFKVTGLTCGTITWSPWLPKLMQPNEVWKTTMIFTVDLNAPLGFQSWNVTYSD
jgi:hypothetical protein